MFLMQMVQGHAWKNTGVGPYKWPTCILLPAYPNSSQLIPAFLMALSSYSTLVFSLVLIFIYDMFYHFTIYVTPIYRPPQIPCGSWDTDFFLKTSIYLVI